MYSKIKKQGTVVDDVIRKRMELINDDRNVFMNDWKVLMAKNE